MTWYDNKMHVRSYDENRSLLCMHFYQISWIWKYSIGSELRKKLNDVGNWKNDCQLSIISQKMPLDDFHANLIKTKGNHPRWFFSGEKLSIKWNFYSWCHRVAKQKITLLLLWSLNEMCNVNGRETNLK